MKTINQIWDNLITYWQANEPSFQCCKGANEKEIEEVEKELGYTLPHSLKDSLKKCNSYPKDWEKVQKSSSLLLGEAGQLYSSEEIINWYKQNLEYCGEFPFENIYGDITSPNNKWDEKWIPIYDYNADIFFAIDMREKNGVPSGKVLYMDIEYSILAVVADSYEEFLNQVCEAILENGQYGAKDLEKILLKYGIEPSE